MDILKIPTRTLIEHLIIVCNTGFEKVMCVKENNGGYLEDTHKNPN